MVLKVKPYKISRGQQLAWPIMGETQPTVLMQCCQHHAWQASTLPVCSAHMSGGVWGPGSPAVNTPRFARPSVAQATGDSSGGEAEANGAQPRPRHPRPLGLGGRRDRPVGWARRPVCRRSLAERGWLPDSCAVGSPPCSAIPLRFSLLGRFPPCAYLARPRCHCSSVRTVVHA